MKPLSVANNSVSWRTATSGNMGAAIVAHVARSGIYLVIIGHSNRDHATSTKRGRIKRFTTYGNCLSQT